jgi:ferric-dicitrate binding protein FerR (iron transport regulator)
MTAERPDPAAAIDNGKDAVAQLIRVAGRRAEPPAEAYEQTLAAALATWDRVQSHRRQRLFATLAASVVVAVGVAFLVTHLRPRPEPSAGYADRIVGTVQERSASWREWSTLRNELGSIPRGTQMRTLAGSRAGIVLASGVSLRLAEGTEVELESASRLHVLAGKVYVDTAGAHRASGIEVVTDAGTAVDVGTQFEVQYRDGEYRLRVREGRVMLRRDAGQVDGQAGEQLTIRAGGVLERARIEADDPEWDWVESLAPAPDIDNQPVTVLLDWVARETGRSVRFANPEVARHAANTILHGNIRHLQPLEALSVMLATTDLEYALPDNVTILVRRKDIQ